MKGVKKMKRLIMVIITGLIVMAVVTSAYAVSNQTQQTTAQATVNSIFQIGFKAAGTGTRSTTSFSFKAVDGTAPRGWYYNTLATLDGNGDPNDSKSDVGILCKSNAHTGATPFRLKIKKVTDSLNTKIGFNVSGAFDAGATTTTPADGVVTYKSGFKNTTGTGNLAWGELATADDTVYTSGTNIYSTYGVLVPISFALVPDGLAAASYSTTITYTMTAPSA
jgi:hypothetical protein